jgi:hypothetical protein
MFRFTIRDVLWLMVVVAMGVAWWRERTNAAHERAERIATQERVKVLKAQNAKLGSFREMIRILPPFESALKPHWLREPVDSDIQE